MPHPFRLRKHLFSPRIKQFFVGAKLQNGDNSQIGQHHFQAFLGDFQSLKRETVAGQNNAVFSQISVRSVRDFAQSAHRQQRNHGR